MPLATLIFILILAVAFAYFLGAFQRRQAEGPQSSRERPARRLARPKQRPKVKAKDEDATDELVHWLLSQAFEQTGVRVAEDEVAFGRIVDAANKTRERLQTDESATISLPFLTADKDGPKHFEVEVTRALMEELARR